MRAKPNQRLNGAGFALVLIALLFRLLVPQGTMVAADGRGPELVICTGHGPMSAPDPAPGKAKTYGDCAFAAHAGTASTPPVTKVAAPIAWTPVRTEAPRAESRRGVRLAAPPPPAIGPPALQT